MTPTEPRKHTSATMPLRYRLLCRLAWPILLWMSWRQGVKADDSTLLPQRLARAPLPGAVDIWVHCASVGEVVTVAPLVDVLLDQGHRVALSVVTPTGAATARKRFGERLSVCYLPIDSARGCARFFAALKPLLGIVVETEIWPHLLNAAKRAGVTLAVVNGRLSSRTQNPPALLRPVLEHAVSQLDCVLARNAADADAWQTLGVDRARIRVSGNLKFAGLAGLASDPPRLHDAPYWLAASTHASEERDIARAWLATPAPRSHVLVIAPRHIARTPEIKAELEALGAKVALFSNADAMSDHNDIVLADSFGDLNAWYAHADAVFVGGSFAPVGGHNLLEPAVHARFITTGPVLHNFKEEAALLSQASGLTTVDDATDLIERISRALTDAQTRKQQGLNAQRAVSTVDGVLARYTAEIDALYARSNSDQPD